jgi:hypothetical protein
MATITLSNPAQVTVGDSAPAAAWKDGLSKSQVEILLDWFEVAGLPSTEIRCTAQGFFGVRLPALLRRLLGSRWPAVPARP